MPMMLDPCWINELNVQQLQACQIREPIVQCGHFFAQRSIGHCQCFDALEWLADGVETVRSEVYQIQIYQAGFRFTAVS